MWGTARIDATCNSYAKAELKYNNTKPVRGTTVRPVGCRRSRYAKARIEKQDESYVLYLWRTPIVTYHKDGSILLNSGGWYTQSTAVAISALSPLTCWTSKGELIVAHRRGDYANMQRFVVPREGLLFKPDEAGKLQPVDPLVAVQRKTRVKRGEAKIARAYFKQVPVFIKAFSAAFEGGQKPQVGWPRLNLRDLNEPLAEEDAVNIAWFFVGERWGYIAGTSTIINNPDRSIATFWKQIYAELDLIEDYEVPLPYGEVA